MEEMERNNKESMAMIPMQEVEASLDWIRQFQIKCKKELIKDIDYGKIPGTDKPTLLKPGAEKIVKLLQLSDNYEFIDKVMDFDKGLIYVTAKCLLSNIMDGKFVSSGVGHCNSYEKRYRYRWVFSNQLPDGMDKSKLIKREFTSKKNNRKYTQYRLDNDDIYDQFNTIIKQACKRALVSAALSAARLSNLFTQDMDEIGKEIEPIDDDFHQEEKKEPSPASDSKPNPDSDIKEGDFNTLAGFMNRKTIECKDNLQGAKDWILSHNVNSNEAMELVAKIKKFKEVQLADLETWLNDLRKE